MKDSTELYWDLNKIYGSKHNDDVIERNRATSTLADIMSKGIRSDFLIAKMKQMAQEFATDRGNFKGKLSECIENRYWEKNFVQSIPQRTYKIED